MAHGIDMASTRRIKISWQVPAQLREFSRLLPCSPCVGSTSSATGRWNSSLQGRSSGGADLVALLLRVIACAVCLLFVVLLWLTAAAAHAACSRMHA